ncbi:unnamed protein product [Ilex paraguariensis]|uniref:Uncharacterized protein n=1 Tax=Ilex paraguariensis TaxID=185542 RepID=A0ABC8UT59_9AQUA
MAVLGGKLHRLMKKLRKNGGDGNVKIKKSNDKKHIRSGFLPIYVGEECEKYEIPVVWLAASIRFKALLYQYEQEIQAGEPITLPCSTKEFDTVLSLIKAETIFR